MPIPTNTNMYKYMQTYITIFVLLCENHEHE